MKLVLRSIQFNTKRNTLRNVGVFSRQYTTSSFKFSQSVIMNSLKYSFTKQKQTSGQEKEPQSKSFKLEQLKQLFETKMNKYNLKGLLKMYLILKHNNVKLTEQSLKEFDYRLNQQLNSMDHQSTNSILQLSYRNGQTYQLKGKNKLLRGINLKIQKNKLKFQPQHVYKTIQLLIEMNFPKSTLSRALFRLVIENQPDKRILYFIDNLNALKICLITIQNVELQLQLKRRVLQNLLLIKPKGVIQLAYFYSVLKIIVQKLQQTVNYEAHKKTVYDLAFNPYSFSEFNQKSTQITNQDEQKNNDTKIHNDKQDNKPQKSSQKSSQNQKPQINQTILKNLINQKDKILEQTFQKFNLQKVSEQLYNQISEILNDPKNDELKFKDKKQIAFLLLANKFSNENNKNKKLVVEILNKILYEGLGEIKSSNQIDSQKLIRVNQFVSFIEELSQSSDVKVIKGWVEKYKQIYYNFMSLQEKLTFNYNKARILNEKVNIVNLKQEIIEIDYGLNTQEFVWLNKVLSINKEKYSQNEKKIVKEIWKHVESNLDQEITELKKDKEQQQNNNKKAQQKQEDQTQTQHPDGQKIKENKSSKDKN